MIINQWTTFRFAFAERVTLTPTTLEFIAPDTLSRVGGTTWDLAGFQVGMKIAATGPGITGANASEKTIAVVAMTGATVDTVEQDITNLAAAGGRTVTGVFRDPDGIERWPVANVRAGGFDAGFTGFTVPYDALVMVISINGQAQDAVAGVDEYDWYLSQRTDEVVNQYFTVTSPLIGGLFPSGSIALTPTALAQTEFGIVPGTILTSAQTVNLFRKMALYVQRRSDDAIQWVDVLRVMVANV